LWSLAAGLWSLVFGLWSLVSGLWPLASGLWPLVSGLWPLASGLWPLASGLWSLASCLWPLASGLWPLASGLWPLVPIPAPPYLPRLTATTAPTTIVMPKQVLVTGGAGFIGSHVAAVYLERGDTVVVLDDLSSGKRANVPDGAEFVEL